MKAIAPVAGGPRTVIAAMMQALGDSGTLRMPTFADPQPDGRFDVRSTPSRTGLITETFRAMPDIRRSLHPTHAVAAWGRRRDELLAGHDRTSGIGLHSPMHKAALAGAKVLLLGCDFTTCSLIHIAEAICRVPYLGKARYHGYEQTLTLIDDEGREHRIPPRDPPGHSRHFVKVAARLQQRGRLQHGRIGQVACMSFDAMEGLREAIDLLTEKPLALLCTRPKCVYFSQAWRAVTSRG